MRTHFRKADIAHLALPDQLSHSADSLLYFCIRIFSVHIVKVYDINSKAFQAGIASLFDIFGAAVNTSFFGIVGTDNTELSGEHNAVSYTLNSFSDKGL